MRLLRLLFLYMTILHQNLLMGMAMNVQVT